MAGSTTILASRMVYCFTS